MLMFKLSNDVSICISVFRNGEKFIRRTFYNKKITEAIRFLLSLFMPYHFYTINRNFNQINTFHLDFFIVYWT